MPRDKMDDHPGRFPSARQDAEHAERVVPTPQTLSPSYRLAYEDPDFLKREMLRPVRLQLEMLKPDVTLRDHGIDATIVVFGSARIPAPDSAAPPQRGSHALLDSEHYENARRLSRMIAELGQRGPHAKVVVVTGGGPGIMEAANRGAADAGAESVGLNIVLPHEQAPNRWITPELCFQFHYFALRKMHLLMRARALVVFPGGFGTMDELFETLTLIQTGKIAPIPVLLFGEEYWRRVIDFEGMAEAGVISANDLSIFEYVKTAEEAMERLRPVITSAA